LNLPELDFKTKTAEVKDILTNLQICDEDFNPPLSQRVNLEEYAQKIFQHAVTFEAWSNQNLIGLVAAYLDPPLGFITNVSVVNDFKRQNIASALVYRCIEFALKENVKSINLEVNKASVAAIKLYNKFNFKTINEDDPDIKMRLII